MPKTKISEYSSTPSNNTDVNGINIAEGCAPSGINNAIRQLMSDLKNQQTGASGDPFTVGGNLSVTGTTTLTGAATAPTPSTSDNSTNIATTAYVTAKVAASTSGLSDPGANGIVVRTSTGTTIPRSIAAGTGISVSNGDGVSENPTISNSGVTSYNGSTGSVNGVATIDSTSPTSGNINLSGLTSFGKSHMANGYQKLPGGLIMQWGKTTALPSGGTLTVDFNTTAPFSTVLNIQLTITDDNNTSDRWALKIGTVSTTQFTIKNSTAATFGAAYWFAIGY